MAKKGYDYLDKMDEYIKKNKTLWFFSIFLLIVLFFLTIGYFNIKKNLIVSVELPKVQLVNGGKVFLGYDKSNYTYYKSWGRYIVYEMGNYTPSNITDKIKDFSFYMEENKFRKYKSSFKKLIKTIKDNSISEEFLLRDDKVSSHTGTTALYTAVGITNKYIGTITKTTQVCTFKIKFKIKNFNIFLEGYSKSCRDYNPLKDKDIKLKHSKKEKEGENK